MKPLLLSLFFYVYLTQKFSFARFSVSNIVLASSLSQVKNPSLLEKKDHTVQDDNCSIIEAASETSSKTAPKSKSMVARLAPILASSFCAAAIMYPLDLVRALQMANAGSGTKLSTIQLLTNFKNTYGFQGFFTQGLVPELARATWMRFIKFSMFPIVHIMVTNGIEESKGNSATKALAAIIASIPEATSIMPLEVAKISLQLDAANKYKNNMFIAMSSLYKERGFGVFTVGYLGIQFRQALWSTGYFVTLPLFNKRIAECIKLVYGQDFNLKENPILDSFATVFSGFLAGVFGGALNTPFDTTRTIMQKNYFAGRPSGSLLSVGKDVVNARGFNALYAGFGFKAFHLGGGGALMAILLPFFNNVFKDFK